MKYIYVAVAITLMALSGFIGITYLPSMFTGDGNVLNVYLLNEDGELVKEATAKIDSVENSGYISISYEAIPDSLRDAYINSDLVAIIEILDSFIVRVPLATSEDDGYIGYIIYKAKIIDVFKGGYSRGDIIHLISLGDIDESKSVLYTQSEIPYFNIGDTLIIFTSRMTPYPGDVYGRLLIKNFPDLYEVPFVGFKVEDGRLSLISPLSPGSNYVGMDMEQFKEEVLPSLSI